MDFPRIKAAMNTIEASTRALSWLEEYGVQLTGRDHNALVRIDLYLAGSCDGSKEALSLMNSYGCLAVPSLVESAIASARNDIEMAEDTIKREMFGD
jgi:hypothetical protein